MESNTRAHVDVSDVAGTSLNDERRDVGTLGEGSMAGALAADGVVLWYLFRDLMAGHALFTPRLLGQLLGIHAMSDGTATAIVGYSWFTSPDSSRSALSPRSWFAWRRVRRRCSRVRSSRS